MPFVHDRTRLCRRARLAGTVREEVKGQGGKVHMSV